MTTRNYKRAHLSFGQATVLAIVSKSKNSALGYVRIKSAEQSYEDLTGTDVAKNQVMAVLRDLFMKGWVVKVNNDDCFTITDAGQDELEKYVQFHQHMFKWAGLV